jgi:hypothetical protein
MATKIVGEPTQYILAIQTFRGEIGHDEREIDELTTHAPGSSEESAIKSQLLRIHQIKIRVSERDSTISSSLLELHAKKSGFYPSLYNRLDKELSHVRSDNTRLNGKVWWVFMAQEKVLNTFRDYEDGDLEPLQLQERVRSFSGGELSIQSIKALEQLLEQSAKRRQVEGLSGSSSSTLSSPPTLTPTLVPSSKGSATSSRQLPSIPPQAKTTAPILPVRSYESNKNEMTPQQKAIKADLIYGKLENGETLNPSLVEEIRVLLGLIDFNLLAHRIGRLNYQSKKKPGSFDECNDYSDFGKENMHRFPGVVAEYLCMFADKQSGIATSMSLRSGTVKDGSDVRKILTSSSSSSSSSSAFLSTSSNVLRTSSNLSDLSEPKTEIRTPDASPTESGDIADLIVELQNTENVKLTSKQHEKVKKTLNKDELAELDRLAEQKGPQARNSKAFVIGYLEKLVKEELGEEEEEDEEEDPEEV